jgi:hypothetical protein
MPGTPVKFRRGDDGLLVLVGKRMSHYRTFAAHSFVSSGPLTKLPKGRRPARSLPFPSRFGK